MSHTRSSGPYRSRTSRAAPRRRSRGTDPAPTPPPPAAAGRGPVSPAAGLPGAAGPATQVLDRPDEQVPVGVDPGVAPERARPTMRSRGSRATRTGGPSTRRGRGRPRLGPRAPKHRLILACTAVLALGLLGVLLLNTIISQGAFRQLDLETSLILTAEKEESLARAVQQAEAPREVEKRARALGMVPAAAPVFLRLSDGKILGTPVPAPAAPGKVSFAGAPGLLPTPSPTPTSTATDAATEGASAAPDGTAASGAARPAATGATPSPSAGPTGSQAGTPVVGGGEPTGSPAASPAASGAAVPTPGAAR